MPSASASELVRMMNSRPSRVSYLTKRGSSSVNRIRCGRVSRFGGGGDTLANLPCIECERKREPYRPVRREVDGPVRFVCKQCWNKFQYCHQKYEPVYENGEQAGQICTQTNYMWHQMTTDDMAALKRAKGIR